MKLVNSEYEHPQGRATAWGARVHFLELIEELAPEVLDDLAGEALTVFRQTGIGELELTSKEILTKHVYRNIGTLWRSIESARCTCDYYTEYHQGGQIGLEEKFLHEECQTKMVSKWKSLRDTGKVNAFDRLFVTKYVHYPKCPLLVNLRKALDAWKNRHNLIETPGKNWCLESAFYSLDHWTRSTTPFKEIGLSTFGTSEHSPYLKSIESPPGLWGWDPEYQERTAYIESQLERVRKGADDIGVLENTRILRKFLSIVQTEAEDYCNQVEKHYRANGWEKIRDRREIRKHLSWAVRFQVKKETLTSIAKSAGASVAGVKKEVEKVLELIGLQKREDSKPGRRLGQKESSRSKLLRELGRA